MKLSTLKTLARTGAIRESIKFVLDSPTLYLLPGLIISSATLTFKSVWHWMAYYNGQPSLVCSIPPLFS